MSSFDVEHRSKPNPIAPVEPERSTQDRYSLPMSATGSQPSSTTEGVLHSAMVNPVIKASAASKNAAFLPLVEDKLAVPMRAMSLPSSKEVTGYGADIQLSQLGVQKINGTNVMYCEFSMVGGPYDKYHQDKYDLKLSLTAGGGLTVDDSEAQSEPAGVKRDAVEAAAAEFLPQAKSSLTDLASKLTAGSK